ncbi:DUF3068 domain-containing protein [Spirillospora sp. NPDC048819]|uniref:DUF3068 domain-containing protein n=1 Tax=Spirillospora sp. NPDC048819 TaxID=3155268 RepID=UPI0033E37BBA
MRRIIGVPLIALGTFLLAAGLLVYFYVGPTLIGAPVDVYQVTRLQADNATYLDASSVTLRTGATVVATNTVRGDVKASSDDIAVWDSGTIVQDVGRGNTIEIQKARYAFDRTTGQLKNCCGAAVQGDTNARMDGIGLSWPLEVRKEGLELLDTGTLRAWPVTFDGEQRVDGLNTYRYVQHIPETKVAGELPALPAELFGRPKGDPAVETDRYYRVDATYWVDPRTGAPIDQQRHVVTTLRPKEGPGSLVVADLDLRMTPESREDLRAKSDEGASQIRLLETVVPLTGVGAGLPIIVAGLILTFAGGRRPGRRGNRRAPAPAARR